MTQEREWMAEALAEARKAFERGEVPVGAVVVHNGQIIARAHDARERRGDPTAHAEMLAMKSAALQLGTWHLEGCTLVVTLEPCPMCAGAAIMARIDRIVWGAENVKLGACGTRVNLLEPGMFNHTVAVTGGVEADECAKLLTQFFDQKRMAGNRD